LKHASIAIVLILFVCGPVPRVYAQILEGVQPRIGNFASQGGSFYNFISPGSGCELKVSVWGFVRNPGRYNIPCETNLLELMSFCGGPAPGAYLDKVKIMRKGGVDKVNAIEKVFEVDLSKYLELTTKSVVVPELLLWPGDLVIVEGKESTPVDMILRMSQVAVAITSIITATVAVMNMTK